jgi:Ca2+:H+ antiporter
MCEAERVRAGIARWGQAMKYVYLLLILVPVALVMDLGDIGGHSAVFITSALGMVPLAALLGRATEAVAVYTGPKIGALLNATLGNAAELIIVIIALREGLFDVVKASIAGSIIGNILVVLGASILFGGLKNGTQTFDVGISRINATMMTLAVVAIMIPAVFDRGSGDVHLSLHDVEHLSDGVAVVMIVLYALYLLYTLRGNNDSPDTVVAEGHAAEEVAHASHMSLPMAIGLLAGSTIAIVVMSELLVGAIEPTAKDWGLSELFIGVMLVPLIGNVAEHLVAVQMAIKNKMDLSLGVAVGSSIQVALFVTPVIVFAGILLDKPITLVFNNFELAALIGATLIAVFVSNDGESNWLEGAMLLAVYAMLGFAFYFT